MRQGVDGDELSSLARSCGERRNTTLESSYSLFEDIDGRLKDDELASACLKLERIR